MMRRTLAATLVLVWAQAAHAEDLFTNNGFASVAADLNANHVGDVITIVVYQATEARNAAQNSSRTGRSFDATISGGDLAESGSLSIDGGYSGEGEMRRSESFLTQISARVEEVRDNGDLVVAGQQHLRINGETTIVRVRGLVRPVDIEHGNRVLSSRLAEAEISYEGQGFVTRNARPNWLHRALSLIGLGG